MKWYLVEVVDADPDSKTDGAITFNVTLCRDANDAAMSLCGRVMGLNGCEGYEIKMRFQDAILATRDGERRHLYICDETSLNELMRTIEARMTDGEGDN